MSQNSSSSDRVINLTPALARVGDDRKLLCDLAGFYFEDSQSLIGELERGIEIGDAELVTRSAHSLKGLSANFDAHSTMDIAMEIENLGKIEDLPAAAEKIPELKQHVEEVIAALHRELIDR